MRSDFMDRLKKALNIIIILFIILEIGLSIYLIINSLKPIDVCIIGESCSAVQNSIYGSILGIKVSYLAILAFVLLLSFKFIHKKIFLLAGFIGAIIALYFISIQLFVLKEICSTCFIIDSIMVLTFLLILLDLFIENKLNAKKELDLKNKKKKTRK